MFIVVLLMGEVFRDLFGLLVKGRISFVSFIKLAIVILPYVLVHALPIGVLVGVLLTMGRLSSQNEILAMRASGFSILQIASPVFPIAIVGAAFAIIINFEFGPKALGEYRNELAETIKESPLRLISERVFVKEFPKHIVYTGEKRDNLLKDLWIWKLDEKERSTRIINADTGVFEYDQQQGFLKLKLQNGSIQFMDRDNPEDLDSPPQQLDFEEWPIELSLDGILGKRTQETKVYWLTFSELLQERKRLEKLIKSSPSESLEQSRKELMQAKMAFQEKFAMGYSVVTLSILGIPLSIVTKRKETYVNLFIAMGIALVYYASMFVVGSLGDWHRLRPDLLYWIPNIALQALGLFLLFRLDAQNRNHKGGFHIAQSATC